MRAIEEHDVAGHEVLEQREVGGFEPSARHAITDRVDLNCLLVGYIVALLHPLLDLPALLE